MPQGLGPLLGGDFGAHRKAPTDPGRGVALVSLLPKGAARLFCPTCGASLYFRLNGGFSVEAGAIDNPTGGQLSRHMFCADKGDYYALSDGLPQSTGA